MSNCCLSLSYVGTWCRLLSECYHMLCVWVVLLVFFSFGEGSVSLCLFALKHRKMLTLTEGCVASKSYLITMFETFWRALCFSSFYLPTPSVFLAFEVCSAHIGWLFSPVNNGSQMTLNLLHFLLQWLCTLTNLGERSGNMVWSWKLIYFQSLVPKAVVG